MDLQIMRNEKNWHRVYFNRQTEAGGPDMPTRVNVNLLSVDQSASAVGLQLEYSTSWKSKNWFMAAPQELVRGLELACCALGTNLRKILNVMEMSTVPLEFSCQNGSQSLTFRWFTPVPGHFWSRDELKNSGLAEVTALRWALVQLLKMKIGLARAMAMPDTARTEDMLARLTSSVASREEQRLGRAEALGREHGVFFGDRLLRERIIAQVQADREAGRLVQDSLIWSGEFGSASGCTLRSEDFLEYESNLAIPAVIGRLQEVLFQRLQPEVAQHWPERFLTAIRPGADLSNIWNAFVVWLLTDQQDGLMAYITEDYASGGTKSTSMHDAIEVLAGMFREPLAAQWHYAASNSASTAQCRKQRWNGQLECVKQVADVMASLNGAGQSCIPLEAVDSIVSLIVETIAISREIRSGKDGPAASEFYPGLCEGACNKLVEMLGAAPVALA